MNRGLFFAGIRDLFDGSLSQSQVNGINAILDQWDRRRLTDIRWLAYMLATTKWETAHTMQPIVERGGRAYFQKYEGRKDLGNTIPGDGYNFRGRGFVQLTGRRNYSLASQKVGVDLASHPDRALDPALSAEIMFLGMSEGWFTSKKLSDYFNAARTDWANARRIINGTDHAAEIAKIGRAFYAALQAARTGDTPRDVPVPTPRPGPQKPPPGTQKPPPATPTAVQTGIAAILVAVLGALAWFWSQIVDFIRNLF